MKKHFLKKLIAIATSICLCLSFSVFLSSDAAELNYNNYNKSENIIYTLNSLGFTNETKPAEYNLNYFISRGEMCELIYRLHTGKSTIAKYTGAKLFGDVPSGSIYEAYIYYSNNMKPQTMTGYPDGTFAPFSYVTVAESIRIFSSLFYNDTTLTFPYDYIKKARDAKLVEGIEGFDWTANIKRSQLYTLLMNTIIKSYFSNSSNGAFLKQQGIGIVKGKIVATQNNPTFDWKVKDGLLLQVTDSGGSVVMVKSPYISYADNLIGYGIYVFFHDTNKNGILDTYAEGYMMTSGTTMERLENATESVFGFYEYKNSTMDGEIKDLGVFSTTADGYFTYKKSGRSYGLNSMYVINGEVASFGKTGELQFERLFGTRNGSFRMVDTDGDAKYDTCFMVTD